MDVEIIDFYTNGLGQLGNSPRLDPQRDKQYSQAYIVCDLRSIQRHLSLRLDSSKCSRSCWSICFLHGLQSGVHPRWAMERWRGGNSELKPWVVVCFADESVVLGRCECTPKMLCWLEVKAYTLLISGRNGWLWWLSGCICSVDRRQYQACSYVKLSYLRLLSLCLCWHPVHSFLLLLLKIVSCSVSL